MAKKCNEYNTGKKNAVFKTSSRFLVEVGVCVAFSNLTTIMFYTLLNLQT
jgi:hypothetical protein